MRKLKESGIEWIGMIPEHWELLRVKNIFKHHKDIVEEKEEEYDRLALTLNGVIKRDKNDSKGLQSKNLSTYQILKEKELVFKMIDLANVNTSRVGYSPFTGIVSPVYILLNNDEYSKYGYYYFYSMWQREIFNNLGNDGVRSALNASDMMNLPFLKMSKDDANKIAIFLDKEVSKIDNAINKTKETIEDYKKYKKSIITKVVTKGLDDSAKMKDSGINWISDIPRDWKITSIGKLSFVTKLAGFEYTKNMDGNINEFGEVPIVRAQNIKMGIFKEQNEEFISLKLSKLLNRCALDKKCLLITFIGAGIGEVTIFNKKERHHLAPNVAKIVIYDEYKKFLTEEYLLYYMMSDAGQEEVNKIKKATAQPSLSMETIRSIKILIPSIKEQNEIVNYLDEKCNEIDKLIESKEKIIEELEQYKKSVIYEYVMGKKEVK